MTDLPIEDLPDNTTFPQTRRQLRDQAAKDHADIEDIHSGFEAVAQAAQAEAANSAGRCHVCGGDIRADHAVKHAQECLMTQAHSNYIIPDVDERYAKRQPIMLWVRSEELRHWMMLVVQPTASLRQLDQFLRDHWLECCGQMSHFQIADVQYSACVPGPGDAPMFDNDLADPDEQHMIHTVEETLATNQQFRQGFDYGHTTRLNLQHVGVIPVPYDYLPEFINTPQAPQGHADDFITIMSRNLRPERSFNCGTVATRQYHENPYIHITREQGGLIVAPPYFCDQCTPRDMTTVILRNSPRVGIGCYENTHDEPEAENFR